MDKFDEWQDDEFEGEEWEEEMDDEWDDMTPEERIKSSEAEMDDMRTKLASSIGLLRVLFARATELNALEKYQKGRRRVRVKKLVGKKPIKKVITKDLKKQIRKAIWELEEVLEFLQGFNLVKESFF